LLQTPFTVRFAIHALAAVLVPPLVPVHHHVHGQLPDIAVGVPDAQVAVGVVRELKVALQAPFTILFALHALAAVLVPPFGLLHHHVHGHIPDTAVGVPDAQVAVGVLRELKVALQAPLIHTAFARLHCTLVVYPLPPQYHVLVVPQATAPLSD
jgi:TctA family transporter